MNWDAAMLMVLKLLAVLGLVLLNGFFVAAELALVRIRDTQLASLAGRGNRRARRARHIVAHIDTYIGATQFGITLASLGLGVAVEPVFNDLLSPVFNMADISSERMRHNIALGVGFFVNCYLLIVAGELVPKAVAIRRTLSTALWTAAPLVWFYRISFPFIWLLHRSSQWILRRLGIAADDLRGGHSEEELRLVLATAQSGTAGGRGIVLNALDLRHRTAREVMRPRHEIIVFDSAATISECVALAEKTRYSRFPICENGDLEKTLGVIHIKDLYSVLREGKAKTGMDLVFLARKLIYVPETAQLEKLLQLFLERKSHFAMVVDEYGGTLGIVTLENVLEALVGQIQDEFDTEKSELVGIGDNVWEATGTLPLHELEKIVGRTDHSEGVATVNGWVTEVLGGFPKVGDTLTVGHCELRVEEMDGTRVSRLRITRRPSSGETTMFSRRDLDNR